MGVRLSLMVIDCKNEGGNDIVMLRVHPICEEGGGYSNSKGQWFTFCGTTNEVCPTAP
jgi:hypothetical protein